MSTRSRLRKERKEIVDHQVKQEMHERYLEQTAGIRKITKWVGLALSGAAVAALVVYLAVLGVRNIPKFKVVSGPFGEIRQTELAQAKFATISTDQGDIKVELDTDKTPNTVANFVLLARKNFYEGTKFHRIVKDFMIQAGDPNSKDADPSDDGTGGPGYTFADEPISGDYTRGVVAMANSGKNTNGSQFFIVQKDTQLPKNYVIFGHVVGGMEVVDKIADTPVQDNGRGEASQPKEVRVINKVIISEE